MDRPDNLIATFSVASAATLAGISRDRVKYWDKKNVVVPSYAGPMGRFYNFRDIVGLRTVTKLRDEHHFSLQFLRAVGERLHRVSDQPWSTLGITVVGREIRFTEGGRTFSSDPMGQRVMELEIDLGAIADDLRDKIVRLRRRPHESVGQVSRNPSVQRGASVVAGTRIRTAAIWELHDDGYTTEEIIAEYPDLTEADVDAAIAHEQKKSRRKSSRAS